MRLRRRGDRGTLPRMQGVLPSWWQPWAGRDVRAAPPLVLPTGAIVACDPLVFLDRARPFARTVPPGTYPVELGLLYKTHGYAAVIFDPAPVAAWLPAVCTGEREPADPRKPRGYGVDAGTGCFTDVATAQRWNQRGDGVDLLARLNQAGYDRLDVAAVDLDGAGNLVAFRSGDGDGTYASYWGVDAGGRALVLMTDFGAFVDDEAWDAPPP